MCEAQSMELSPRIDTVVVPWVRLLEMVGLTNEWSTASRVAVQRSGPELDCSNRPKVDYPAAKCCHKSGINVPVTASSINCHLSPLKAFLNRQIVTDSVLPAFSVLGEAGIVVLEETIDPRQRRPLLGWAKDGISNHLYVREWTRISPSSLLLFLLLIAILSFPLFLWSFAVVFPLPCLFCPVHAFSKTSSSWEMY